MENATNQPADELTADEMGFHTGVRVETNDVSALPHCCAGGIGVNLRMYYVY